MKQTKHFTEHVCCCLRDCKKNQFRIDIWWNLKRTDTLFTHFDPEN